MGNIIMQSIIDKPYFPYQAWVPTTPKKFGRDVIEEERKECIRIYGGTRPKCMIPICNMHDDLECHHIIPRKIGGSSNIDNAILLCPNCHKKAASWIIPPDMLTKIKNGQNPNLNLLKKSDYDLGDTIIFLSEFRKTKIELSPASQWELMTSVLWALSLRDETYLRLKIKAWTLSVMAGFCISYMRGGKFHGFCYHPRYIINTLVNRSNIYNHYVKDLFLDIHNSHHRATNENAIENFQKSSKYINRTYNLFKKYKDNLVNMYMPIDKEIYQNILDSHYISINAKSLDHHFLIDESWDSDNNFEKTKSFFVAAILLSDEKKANYLAEKVIEKYRDEISITAASTLRVISAWLMRKGHCHLLEAEEKINQSIIIAKKGEYNHQLEKSNKLKSILNNWPESIRFSTNIRGSEVLLSIL